MSEPQPPAADREDWQPGRQWPYELPEDTGPEAAPRPGLVRGARITLGVLLLCFVVLPFSGRVGQAGPILLGFVVFLTGCAGAMMASHAGRLGLLAGNVVLSMLLLPWFVWNIFRMIGLM